jgi:hypothetical protein
MRSLHLLAVLTLLVANWSTPLSSPAQNATAAGASLPRREAPREIKHELLTSIPGDIKVPIPPDAKFMAGYRSQYSPTRLTTEIRFQSQNSKSKMLDWYQQSLTGSGWTVKENGSGEVGGLSAFKSGLFCSLHFRDAGTTTGSSQSAPSSSSMVLLNYSENR